MDTKRVDEIAKRVRAAIKQGIEAAKLVPDGGNPAYTREVKESLAKLGHDLGFTVAASTPSAHNGAWLFDLAWFSEQKLAGRTDFLDFPLASECEWEEDLEEEILSDFHKLMIAHTWLRVMICQARDSRAKDRIFARLREVIRTYAGTQPGDRYLFACFINDPAVMDVRFEDHIA